MTSFCDNPMCPHHKLEMNDEKHYHSGDEGVKNSIAGVLKTNLVKIKFSERIEKKKFRFYKFITIVEHKDRVKEYHFCDICYNIALLLKGMDYE
jgi:hypothetical protein